MALDGMTRALALVAALVLAACAAPSGPLHPLVVGWESYFDVEWSADRRGDKPVIAGRVHNRYGSAMADVRLLVEALDAQGNVVAQRLTWLGTTLSPFDSAYFEVPAPAPAESYRVAVYSFDRVESGDFARPRFRRW